MSDKLTLYANASKGGKKQWSIWIHTAADGTPIVHVEWGLVGGTLQRSADPVTKGKGKEGTKSYKTPAQVAQDNYDRQVRKKREEGYLAEGETAVAADYFTALDKNFVPAKPIQTFTLDDILKDIDKNGGEQNYIIQRKRDGRRHLVLKTRDGKIRIFSRRMEELTDHLAELRDEFMFLNIPNGTIIDGEVLLTRGDKDDYKATGQFTNPASDPTTARGRIHTLVNKEGARLRFMPFDVLFYNEAPMWQSPYEMRFKLLVDIFQPFASTYFVLPETFTNFAAARHLVQENGWEGLVLWRKHEPTIVRMGGQPKRVNCIKWKPIQEGDFIAGGFFNGSGEFSNVAGGLYLSQYAPDGTMRECGKVGTGFNTEMRHEILTWEFPCVVEVEYDRQEATGKLRFPVFLRKRDDKDVKECVGVELDAEDAE